MTPIPPRSRPIAAGMAMLLAPLLALAQVPPPPAGAQSYEGPGLRVSTAVLPETVTIGEPFRTVLRVHDPGGSVTFSAPAAGDSLQQVDSLRVEGGADPTAVYTLVAWYAEAPLETRVPVRVTSADGTGVDYRIGLRLPHVRSVLPADTAGLEPRPARGLLATGGGGRAWWPWLLLLAVLLLAAAAHLLLRRRRTAAVAGEGARERALRRLEELLPGTAGHRAGPERLYPAATEVLRDYLAESSLEWGRELTSTELLARAAAAGVVGVELTTLSGLLAHADAVKFGRHRPRPPEIERFVAELRVVIERLPADSAVSEAEVAA